MSKENPASSEPVYLISENQRKDMSAAVDMMEKMGFTAVDSSFDVMYVWRGIDDEIRARGPVAQQAPVVDYGMCEDFCIYYKSISTKMGEAHFCRKNDKLVETVTSCPALFQKLKEHDAALIAQAREDVLGFLDELISPSVSDARKHEIVESLRRGVGK